MNDTVLDRIVVALDGALDFDPNVVTAPIAILWPDEGRQWETAVSELQQRRRVVRCGAFDAAQHQGPAYWLRCVIAATVELNGLPDGVPIIYLPGVSRDTMRALDTLAPDLAPLGALQHRCQWFSYPNGKDWTVRSLLSNKERGLGLNVAGDPATGEALVASLGPLLEQPIARLEARHIDAGFLNGLLNPDPIRSLLNWLDDPAGMRNGLKDEAWAAFVQQCKHDFAFDPAADGEIEGARRLGAAKGTWAQVWRRFRESPADYAGIPGRLRQAEPAELVPENPGAWPGAAEDAEDRLRERLTALEGASAAEARRAVLELEAVHRSGRGYVWAELGWTPLMLALEHLAEIARRTAAGPTGDGVADIVDWYASDGWRADRSLLAALDEVDRKEDFAAVEAAATATYRPWLETTATALQTAIGPAANSGNYTASPSPSIGAGEVVVFVDGLRLDVAHLLDDRLRGAGMETLLSTGLAALPTVTQTSKPALVPIDQALLSAGSGHDAHRAPDGPPAGVQVLRALLTADGVQVLGADDIGNPDGSAWTEIGEIDRRGHELGVRLAHSIDEQVQQIARRIRELLDAGWAKVTVVTDHGWLLLPGTLPKCHALPVAVTETKKGRCARIKPGAEITVPTVPWHWDHDVRIALAPGISCFEGNQTYEHGGVSPQECVVPRMTVTRTVAAASTKATITNIKWRGLTLVVHYSGLPDTATIDLRRNAGDPATSIADMARMTGGAGKVLLLVGDEDLEGETAHLVIAGADGALLAQREVTVGQNR